MQSCQLVFDNIYKAKIWGDPGDGSGSGSEINFTENMRINLAALFRDNNIQSMLDAPCGSAKWTSVFVKSMKHHVQDFRYHGIDVSEIPLQKARKNMDGLNNVTFTCSDISVNQLPSGYDVVLCRDALQHLSMPRIYNTLSHIAHTDSKIIIIGGYQEGTNREINDGDYFSFNPVITPFNLVPSLIIPENHPPGQPTKSLFVFDGNSFRKQVLNATFSSSPRPIKL